jgi:hypothetical protein
LKALYGFAHGVDGLWRPWLGWGGGGLVGGRL